MLYATDIAKFKETFTTLFNAGVIEGSFKWHEMERERGKVDYSIVDNMLAWADKEGIPLRGHCIFWGIPNRVQDWLKALSDDEMRILMDATNKHFTLKTNPLKREDLDDFVACWFGLSVEEASRLFSENQRRDAAATLEESV